MADLTIIDVDAFCNSQQKHKVVLFSSQSATKNVKQTQLDFNHNGIIQIEIKWRGIKQKDNSSIKNNKQITNFEFYERAG